MFKDDDLLKLLFESNTAQGIFNQLNWDSQLESDYTSTQSELISLHESYHNELNNASIYGVLLQFYAFLGRSNEQCQTILKGLVKNCRISHEVYATCMSCWLMNQVAKRKVEETEKLIIDLPQYIFYLRLGNHLTRDFSGAFLKEQALSAIIYFVFNRGNIMDKVLFNRIKGFKTNTLRSASYPDAILERIKREVPDKFFLNAWKKFKKTNSTEINRLAIFERTEQEIPAYLDAIEKQNDMLTKQLIIHFHDELRQFFSNIDTPDLSPRLRFDYYRKLIEIGDDVFPDLPVKKRLVLNDNPEDDERNTLLNFQGERIINSIDKIQAMLYPLDFVNVENWNELAVGDGDKRHFYLVYRTKSKLIEQYQFDQETVIYISNLPSEELLLMRRSVVVNGQRIVELILLEHPKHLEQLYSTKNNSISMLCNLSFFSMHQLNYSDVWEKHIQNYCISTTLIDIPLFNKFDTHFNQYEQVLYEFITIKVEENNKTALVFLGFDGKLYTVYILPCSKMVAQSIIHYLLNTEFKNQFSRISQELLSFFSDLIVINISHLLREEHFFDLNRL